MDKYIFYDKSTRTRMCGLCACVCLCTKISGRANEANVRQRTKRLTGRENMHWRQKTGEFRVIRILGQFNSLTNTIDDDLKGLKTLIIVEHRRITFFF